MIIVWHKYWSHGYEQRGVSRSFATMEEAKTWTSQNVGNWQFEEHPNAVDNYLSEVDAVMQTLRDTMRETLTSFAAANSSEVIHVGTQTENR